MLKRVFLWDKYLNDCKIINTWSTEVMNIFSDLNQQEMFHDIGNHPVKLFIAKALSLLVTPKR